MPVIQIGVTLEISRIWIMRHSDLREIDRQEGKGDFSKKYLSQNANPDTLKLDRRRRRRRTVIRRLLI
jgi:hypothetical protein